MTTLKYLFKIPRKPLILACSGGPDSMAVLDFMNKGGHDFSVAYFNHKTKYADANQDFLERICQEKNIPFISSSISGVKGTRESQEEYWRRERYSFLRSLKKDIVVCHHLDDVVETWLFSAFNGNPKLIPWENNGVIRPFLITRKNDFLVWCENNNVEYWTDQSNDDERYMRNLIRKSIIPEVLRVNPGIHNTLKKKIIKSYMESV